METREELLNRLSNAVSIINNLSGIQQRLNNVRSQYKAHEPSTKRKKRATYMIIFFLIIFAGTCWGNIGVIIGAVGGFVGKKYYYKHKNGIIDQANEELKKREQAVITELQSVQALYHEQLSTWYPDNYCSVDAVEFFYNVIKNQRADTLKEAINLYETTLHQKRVEQNQQQAIQQQKLNNLLAVGNLAVQGMALGEQKRHNAAQEFASQTANRTLNDIRNRL